MRARCPETFQGQTCSLPILHDAPYCKAEDGMQWLTPRGWYRLEDLSRNPRPRLTLLQGGKADSRDD